MVQEGDEAPSFQAPNQEGNLFTPNFDKGVNILYFYPKDGTPGCRTEAVQFSKEKQTLEEAGIGVYGISTDKPEVHKQFVKDNDLSVELLSDPDGIIADKYGVSVENGRAERTTFILVDSKVHRIYENIDPDGHSRRILKDLLEENLIELQ